MIRSTLLRLRVRRLACDRTRGELLAGPVVIRCALGRSGPTQVKREGDGATPRGAFRMRAGVFRADRLPRPSSGLAFRPTRADDGWCDDPRDRRYNRPISLPAPGLSAETMWRADGLYDLVIDLDYNRGPIRRGRGSAIFMHAAREGFGSTEGCVALRRADLVRLLRRVGPRTVVVVG